MFTIAPVITLLIGRPSPSVFWPGLALVALGECIRVWAAGFLVKYSRLTTAGPFALCRNPMYIGSFLMCLGYLLMCHRPWLLVVGLAIFLLFHGGAILHEEKLLAERFGEEYRAYCDSVPRLLPRIRPLSGEGRFSIGTLMLNNELQGVACAMLMTLLFALLAYWPSYAPLGQLEASLRQ